MNGTIFAQNPAFRAYEQGLIRLSQLDAEGKNDSEEADAVRDAMERPYRQLSQPERDRLRGLSADLYMLQDDEVFEPLQSGQTQADLEQELKEAWHRHDMEELLRLLRKGPAYLSEEGLASLRAHAYQSLGCLEAALAFQEYAVQLNPQQVGPQVILLGLLYDLDRREAAVALARNIIADPNASPDMVAYAGHVLSRTASTVPEEQGENSFATAQRNIVSRLESFVAAA